jgi:CoA:oxalate CoA-transferase
MTPPSRRPLDGITVLDLTVGLAGPYATLLLGGLGARVIKIERPPSKEGEFLGRDSAPYIGRDGVSLGKVHADDIGIGGLTRLRNKLCVSLDMKQAAGTEVFYDLARKADVVIENLSRGTAARIGAGYDKLRAINPGIIYCSITGAGHEDTSGSGKTIDTVVQAMSGLMTVSGNEGEPPMRCGVPLADLVTPLYAVIGILAAANQRRETGEGQQIDVSMLGAITSLLSNEPFDALESLGVSKRTGPTVPRLAPLGVYPCADGDVAICTVSDARFRTLARIMGRDSLITDERFALREARTRNYQAIDAEVETWTRTLPAAEIVRRLDAADIPAGEVRSTADALRDPRGLARGDVVAMKHPVYGATHELIGPGVPIKFSASQTRMDDTIADYAAHNEAVYGGILGYDAARLDALRAARVI